MGTHLRENLLLAALKIVRRFDRRQPEMARLGGPTIKKILAISCTAIGDTLMSTPAIRSLRLAYPNAHITLLLNRTHIPLFTNNPDINETLPYDGGYKRFLRLAVGLHRRHFDLAVILHGNEPQATPLAYLSGADFRFKLPNNNQFRFLLSNHETIQRWEDFGHGIEQRLAVAVLAGGRATDRTMTVVTTEQARQRLLARLENRNITEEATLVGFQAGASTVSRRWPAERFAELAKRLLADNERTWIVLSGSRNERALAEKIATLIDSSRVWVAAGEPGIDELPALFGRMRVLVSGDTGPMHLAVAVRTPVVALFAVSDWRRSGPAYDLDRHQIIQKWRTCSPCLSKRCPYTEPPCMNNISVDEVEEAIREIVLQKRGNALTTGNGPSV
ncbi:glycosyltransferase family 9 protein [Rhodocyclus tenuis]|uniref:Glycosyltransferase family 9 protein n=1 Tax=Rhodocyclus gracilis TaxID=2929842 RepID=A0ABX0WMN0_9RHOO|nr:glycosyltransferase family 9 protein [Rhodocyclus gracilis]MRD74006.1 glycosyltransferase family 9 protein [Rhodocyclus gracilis]NJA89986.1 glycosyltransferase family 9 protein [Rhodocyclus gracilis]